MSARMAAAMIAVALLAAAIGGVVGATVAGRVDDDDGTTRPTHRIQRGAFFRDPCGGSVYDISGHRLFGPAPRDLDTFSVVVANNETIVDTRKLTCGDYGGAPAPVCLRAPLGD